MNHEMSEHIDPSDLDEPVKASIDAVRKVVADKQYASLYWDDHKHPIVLDLFTAGRIMQCYEAVKSENKTKMERMIAASSIQFLKVVNVCLSV